MTINQSIYGYLVKEERYENNDYIIKEGTSGDWIYVILEGKVRINKITPRGQVTLNTLQEGNIFGEKVMWKAGQGPRSTSAIASGPVKVGILDTERLTSDYEAISPKIKSLMKSLMARLEDTTRKAVNLAVGN